jgi:hypothetical protein
VTDVISYYVYEHRRKDTGEIFYIGKGSRLRTQLHTRANSRNGRNIVWNRIVNKHDFITTVVAEFFKEEDAFNHECELIKSYGRRNKGGILCNLTDGGEGAYGNIISIETRQKISASNKGRKVSDKTKLRLSIVNTGKIQSEETKAKLSKINLGKTLPKETRKKISEGLKGRVISTETKVKLSIANKGKTLSEETKLKIGLTSKGRKMPEKWINKQRTRMTGRILPKDWVDSIRAAKIGEKNPMFGKTGAAHPNSRRVINKETGVVYDSVQIAADSLGYKMKTLYNWLSGHRINNTNLEFHNVL